MIYIANGGFEGTFQRIGLLRNKMLRMKCFQFLFGRFIQPKLSLFASSGAKRKCLELNCYESLWETRQSETKPVAGMSHKL